MMAFKVRDELNREDEVRVGGPWFGLIRRLDEVPAQKDLNLTS
jgi:hypothetical protein